MKLKLDGYNEGFKIVSLAFDEYVKTDLLADQLDFLFVSENEVTLYPAGKRFDVDKTMLNALRQKSNYDVYEVWKNGVLVERYSNRSLDNYFFVTGKCNSNCIMCPSPDFSREHAEKAYIDDLIEIAKHIPSDAGHLTITGGEPFMAGEDIFRFLKFLHNKFLQTEFLILTNGRVFCLKKYVDCLHETIPNNCIIGIPLHGSTRDVHDRITRAKGSFAQTLSGIKNLRKIGVRIELRLVVCRANLNDFAGIAGLIINELHGIEHVSIMAMEMTGNAYVNREDVWVPYSEAFIAIESAVSNLLNHGIDVRLYNFPLCTVADRFWPICEKSISPRKVRFAENCNDCRLKTDCGGIFSGTYMLEKDELRAIQ